MADTAKKDQSKLESIKHNIEKSYKYFEDNYKRWHWFNKFLFYSTLTSNDKAVLKDLQRPEIEFNVVEAYISRMRGEFAKQEPSIDVYSDGISEADPETIEIVQGYIRQIEEDSRNNGTAYRIYGDALIGGFSVGKVSTEYANERSFEQVIKYERVFDPTLCGFDPLATAPHKGDGNYCFELYPMTEDAFKETYPNVDTSKIKYSRSVGDYSWSYKSNNEKIVLIGMYYEKQTKRKKLLQISSANVKPRSMLADEYKDLLKQWDSLGHIEQPPVILNERMTDIVTIDRYIVMETDILEVNETNQTYLPLVFFDGNSSVIKDAEGSQAKQHTRPYIYNTVGTQRLKNVSGQTLANELQTMVQAKWMAPKEGIPPEYSSAYTDVQHTEMVIYNQFKDNNPDVRLDKPTAVPRAPIPQEIIQTFSTSDQTIQGILGSYDAALGINNNNLSGKAITEGATQSNAANMPYLVGHLQGFNQIALIVVDLIPKYYKTPRTFPIKGKDGDKEYVSVNGPGDISLDYDASALKIGVKPGVNFSIQKHRSLEELGKLTAHMPVFAEFMNTYGLPVIVENMEINGIDQLKEAAKQFQQQLMQQQQQQGKDKEPDPQTLLAQNQQLQLQTQQLQAQNQQEKLKNERLKIIQTSIQHKDDNTLKAANVAVDKENADTNRLKALTELNGDELDREIAKDKQQQEKFKDAVEVAIDVADAKHRHLESVAKVATSISKDQREGDQAAKDDAKEQTTTV